MSDGYRTFTYDDENELTSIVVSNGVNTPTLNLEPLRRQNAAADSQGIHLGLGWLETAEVRYIYDGNVVIQERDGNNLPATTYTRGRDLSGSLQGAGGIGGLLARTDNTQTALPVSQSPHSYYHCDGNGNITALINWSQAIVAPRLNTTPPPATPLAVRPSCRCQPVPVFQQGVFPEPRVDLLLIPLL